MGERALSGVPGKGRVMDVAFFLPFAILVLFALALFATRRTRKGDELDERSRRGYLAGTINRTTPRDDVSPLDRRDG